MHPGFSLSLKLLSALLFISLAAACATTTSSEDDMPTEEETSAETTQEVSEEEEAHHGHHGHHEHQGHHDHRFEDPERYAESWNDPARHEWQQPDAIIEAMEIDAGMTVADIGAGTGYFIPFLSEAVGEEGQVLAVDVEEVMLEYIQESAEREGWTNVDTVKAGEESGLEEASVDRIVTINTWHHIPNREAYSEHLATRLKEGGSAWVVDFHEDSPMGPPPEHRLPPEVVIQELEAGGFQAELHELRLERQYIVVATLP